MTPLREYCSQLSQYREQCQQLLEEAGSALTSLATMRERHQFVSQRTGALHRACEQLMEDQVNLLKLLVVVAMYSSMEPVVLQWEDTYVVHTYVVHIIITSILSCVCKDVRMSMRGNKIWRTTTCSIVFHYLQYVYIIMFGSSGCG